MDDNLKARSKYFVRYGVGIVAFFEIQRNLINLFAFLTIGALLQMGIYASVGGYSASAQNTPFYARTSFGNMGFAKTLCATETIHPGADISPKLSFMCEVTTVID